MAETAATSVREEMAAKRSSDIEKTPDESDNQSLLLDKHGLPLSPQPTASKNDPLNWNPTFKLAICLQVSFLAFIGPMAAAFINPAFVPLSKAFGITPVQASYELTVYLIFAGFGPFLVLTFAKVYGRRPIMLMAVLLAGVTNVIAGYSTTWAGVMITRGFNGMAVGTIIALGPPIVCDLYFLHERGFYMGIFALFLNNGPHLAPFIGGFIEEYLGWRWCYTIGGYIELGVWVINIFCLPETLYDRGPSAPPALQNQASYWRDLLVFDRKTGIKLSIAESLRPFLMARYVAVILPALYYMTCLAYGSVIFALSGSVVYTQSYGFDSVRVGLILSIPLLIGNIIGEAMTGWVIDWLMYRYSTKHGGVRIPESRLDALWFALFLPIGTIITGVCISHSETASWVGNAIGMAISSIGFQVATTVVYTYCTDCYKPQSVEVSMVISLSRHIFSALLSFYVLPLSRKIGFEYAWLIFALINIVLLIPLFLLRIYGQRIRSSAWQKPPTFQEDS